MLTLSEKEHGTSEVDLLVGRCIYYQRRDGPRLVLSASESVTLFDVLFIL